MARSKGTGYLKKRGKYYYLVYVVNGEKTTKSLRVSNKNEAEKKAKEFLESSNKIADRQDFNYHIAKSKGIVKQNSFKLFRIWEEFKKLYINNKDILQTTSNRYKYRLDNFIDWFNNEYPDIKEPYKIEKKHVLEYLNILSNEGLASKTYNDTLNNLQKIFEIISDVAGISDNPFKDVPRKELCSVQKQVITDEQVHLLLKTVDGMSLESKEEYRLLLKIAAYTGARLKDCCLIEWDNINFTENYISLTPYKTIKHCNKAIIPILGELRSELTYAQENRVNNFVLPYISGLYKKNRKYVISVTNKIFVCAGLKNMKKEVEKKTGKNKPCLYGFHSFRYYFASLCARRNVHPKITQEAVGHSSPGMTNYYTILNNKDRQKAFGLDNSMKSKIIKLLDNADNNKLEKVYKILND